VPAGLVSTQVGTLVKLVRVLMLGPLVVGLSLVAPRLPGNTVPAQPVMRSSLFKLVPWFILGFLMLAALRSVQVIPGFVVVPITKLAAVLTIVSMAALGLGVDIRVLSRVGGRVTVAVTLSLILLLMMSTGLVFFLK